MIPTLPADFLANLNGSAVVWGMTGMGKSKLLLSTALAIIWRARQGVTLSCPHGSARELAEHLANPANGYSGAVVHYLDCGSSDWTFGLQPFDVDEDNPSPEACHDAAVFWASCVAAVYATAMTATPRLETYLYALGLFAAAKKLTLIELLAAISLSGGAIRDFMLADIDNPAIVGVLTDLNELAKKHPARFLEQLESCRNRLGRWLGDPRLMRIFGERNGLNARKIMDGREHVLFDPSALVEDDANFLSNILVSRYFAAAKRRPPNACAPHRLIIDEAAGSFSTVTSKLAAQARKYGLFGIWGMQSKAQADEKSEFITQNLVTNAAAHVVFRTPEPDAARYLTELCCSGFFDLQEYKPDSFRPVAVGNEKVIVRGTSRAMHEAEAQSAGISDTRSAAYASATMSASMFSTGSAFAAGDSASFVSLPPDPLLGSSPVVSKTLAHNSSRVGSSARGNSSARSSSYQQARSHARTRARTRTSGTSEAGSETEQYITRFEVMGTTMYSLEEQTARIVGEIQNLPARECFVKVHGERPFRVRTATVNPAFKSIEFRNAILPRFLESAARRSPYLVPPAQVDAEIAARLQAITTPEPKTERENFSPEPDPSAAHVAARAGALRRALQEATPRDQTRPHLRVITGKDGDSSS